MSPKMVQVNGGYCKIGRVLRFEMLNGYYDDF